MIITKKRILAVLGGAAMAATLAGPAMVNANGNDRPPKQAVDQMKQSLSEPHGDEGGGLVDPSKDSGVALVLRDPETGLVQRDPATGLPLVVNNVRPQTVPAEQRLAQGRQEERMNRAAQGDVHAQNELRDEAAKTREAVQKHRPEAAKNAPPPLPLPAR